MDQRCQIECGAKAALRRRCARQRIGSTGTALVHEDNVAVSIELGEEWENGTGYGGCRLPGPSSKDKYRIDAVGASRSRKNGNVDVNRPGWARRRRRLRLPSFGYSDVRTAQFGVQTRQSTGPERDRWFGRQVRIF